MIISAGLVPVLVRIRLLLAQIQRSKSGREKWPSARGVCDRSPGPDSLRLSPVLSSPDDEFVFSEKVAPLYSPLGELLRCRSLLTSLGHDALCLTASQRSAGLAWWVTVFCVWNPAGLGCQSVPFLQGGLWTHLKMVVFAFPLAHFVASSGDNVAPSSLKSSGRKLIRMLLVIRRARPVSVWQLGV